LKEKAALNLSESIQFKTISYQDRTKLNTGEFKGFHEFLEKTYPLIHEKLTKEIVSDFSLLYTWEGSDSGAKPIALTAHMDVVPIADGTINDWTHPPFDGRIEDGYIWGRGSMDCKCFLIAIMEAVEGLLAEDYVPRRTIYLAFGHDEEIGGAEGAIHIASLLQSRGVDAEYVIDEGGFIVDGRKAMGVKKPIAAVGISEKGYLTLELVVEAEGGHSSMPPPHTAIGILATAIHRLERKPFPARLEGASFKMFKYLKPELPFYLRIVLNRMWLFGGIVKAVMSRNSAANAMIRTTIATTIIEAGAKENVLPQTARAVINFRLLPGDSVDYVVSRVRKTVNDHRVTIKTTGTSYEASEETDDNSKGFEILSRTIRELFPETVLAPFLVLGYTDSRQYSRISRCILRFGPLRVGPDDQERAHGTDERISEDNFKELLSFYDRIIRNSN